jgi:hypothetical protein
MKEAKKEQDMREELEKQKNGDGMSDDKKGGRSNMHS